MYQIFTNLLQQGYGSKGLSELQKKLLTFGLNRIIFMSYASFTSGVEQMRPGVCVATGRTAVHTDWGFSTEHLRKSLSKSIKCLANVCKALK